MLYLLIFLLIILFLITIGMFLFVVFFGRPFFTGAPYAPTKTSGLDIILRLADIKPGDKMCDLGSGDGRIIIAAAQAGAEAHGYEINPFLVWYSRQLIKKAGLTDRAFIHRGSFWRANLQPYSCVIVFGIPHIMKRLAQQLEQQLDPGTQVISNVFPLPGWHHERIENKFFIYRR